MVIRLELSKSVGVLRHVVIKADKWNAGDRIAGGPKSTAYDQSHVIVPDRSILLCAEVR